MTHDDIRHAFESVTFNRPVSNIVARAKRRRHRRNLALGAIPAVGLVAAGGTAWLRAEKVSATNVACYGSAKPPSFGGSHSPQTTGETPEELCAKEWAAGYYPFRWKKDSEGWRVPPLKACAVQGGWIGVFPTDDEDFCSKGRIARKYKFSEIPEGYREHIDRYVAMRTDAIERVRDESIKAGGNEAKACLDEAAARELAEDVLADHGYTGWKTRVQHSDAPLCWTHINFDNTAREVVLYSTKPGLENIWINDAGVFPSN